MTCTTHHICDCMKERMEKLERFADSAKKFGDAHIQFQLNRLYVAEYAGFYNSFHSALKALDSIGGGDGYVAT